MDAHAARKIFGNCCLAITFFLQKFCSKNFAAKFLRNELKKKEKKLAPLNYDAVRLAVHSLLPYFAKLFLSIFVAKNKKKTCLSSLFFFTFKSLSIISNLLRSFFNAFFLCCSYICFFFHFQISFNYSKKRWSIFSYI